MTKKQAEEILKKPRFGDPEHIEAVKRLREEWAVQQLRDWLVGRDVQCGACGGTGDRCKVCRQDGSILITRKLVNSWDLDILWSVAEEILPPELQIELEYLHKAVREG